MNPPVDELVARAQAGDAAAFTALVHDHYDRLFRLALRLLGDRSDAEEAVQDTFIRAYRALRSYHESGRFGAWLLRILINRCRSVQSKLRRQRRALTRQPLDVTDFVEPPGDMRFTHALQNALNQLPIDLRVALLLKYVEEMSYEDMAVSTGSSVSALKMRVKRAREQVRDALSTEAHRVTT